MANKDKQSPEVLNVNIKNIETKELTTTFHGTPSDFEEYFNRGAPLYVKQKGISIPYASVVPHSAKEVRKADIKTADGRDLNCEVISDKENVYPIILIIEKFITITYEKNKFNFKFDLKKLENFKDLIKGLSILESIINHGYYLGASLTKLKNSFDQKNYNQLLKFLDESKFIKKINKVIQKLNIRTDFNFFSLSKRTQEKLYSLYKYLNNDEIDGFMIETIEIDENLYYVLIGSKQIANMFTIDNDYILMSYSEKDKSDKVYLPPSLYPRDRLEKVVDYSTEKIFWNLEKLHNENDKSVEVINQYLLDILNTYDRCKQKRFINLAEKIAELLVNEKDDVTLINYLQTVKRKRELSKVEINQLKEMKNREITTEQYICAEILLDNEVDKLIETLDKTAKKDFFLWPISNLII